MGGYLGQKMMSDDGVMGASEGAASFLTPSVGSALTYAGGSFLSQYLAQRAADERAKRQQQMEMIQGHAQGEQNQLGQLMNAYKSALLR